MAAKTYADREAILSLAVDLISIRSETARRADCKRAIDHVQAMFAHTPFSVQRFERNGVISLVIAKQTQLTFDLILLGHLDVVPGPDPAFSPRIVEDKLYGRGAADMKGACAVMIQLLLAERADKMLDNAALVLTTDEEVGGFGGVGYLVAEHGLRCRTLFNPDGGGAFAPCESQKGVLHLSLHTRGRSCHASRPWDGENAIVKLLDDLDAVRRAFDYATQAAKERISLNVGRIAGGDATNAVADDAVARLDLRFPPPHSVDSVLTSIRKRLKHAELTVDLSGEPVAIDRESAAFRALADALQAHGLPTKTKANHTASDARWFVKQQSTVLLILPEASGGHIDEEWASIGSLMKLYDVTRDFCRRHALLS